ncbi:MAG: type VII secretion-associated protein, partial [Mycobacterium sp.]
MSPVVVVVGPQAIRGPNDVASESVSVALECIDDDLALLDDQVVEVRRLWSDLLAAAAGECAGTLVLVVPTWWSTARVELLEGAARGAAADVVVLRRGSVLSADSGATVVEFGDEFLVIVSPSAEMVVLPRDERDVVARLAGATEIVVDVPAAVSAPAPNLAARLHAGGA